MIRTTACVTLLVLCAVGAPTAVAAQNVDENLGVQDRLDLLSEGARRLLEELQEDLTPLLRGLADELEGLNAYEAPEILPNGDIIIRRKPDPGPTPRPDNQLPDDGPIEL